MCVHMHIHVCTDVHTYAHICMHTHVHKRTHYTLLIVVVAAEETSEIHRKQLKDSNFPFK